MDCQRLYPVERSRATQKAGTSPPYLPSRPPHQIVSHPHIRLKLFCVDSTPRTSACKYSMDTSSNLPEDDNSSKWAPSPRVVNSNPLTYEDILAGPNMHETQPSIEPAFGANPIYPHTSISSHTDPNLAWHPVVPTQFHDGGLEEDVVAASRGIFDSAPVPYTSAEFPGVQSQMSLSRFNALFPPPRDPDHTPTGCSVTDSNVVVGEAGRTYHGYKEGAYDLPNDAV